MTEALFRVLLPAATSFLIAFGATPVLTHYLYKYKAWKKRAGKTALDGATATEFNRLHSGNEVRAPRMGGILIWGAVFLTTAFFFALSVSSASFRAMHLNFFSRAQTWIPLAALLIGAIAGLVDDLLVIRPDGKGLQLRYRLGIVFLVSLSIGWWFWAKLGFTMIDIPFSSPLEVGWLIIPFFIFVSLCVYASGVIDGIDGLSGGVFASIFAAYTVIAFAQHQYDIAGLCAAIVGATLAFLWFNVPPARFYMSDTGTMALTLILPVIAFMTDRPGGGVGIAVLPIIGGLLVATVVSDVLQVFWKKAFGRKLLRIAPLHHHFEAIGWSGAKVVMRFWILSIVFASAGVIIALLSY